MGFFWQLGKILAEFLGRMSDGVGLQGQQQMEETSSYSHSGPQKLFYRKQKGLVGGAYEQYILFLVCSPGLGLCIEGVPEAKSFALQVY